MSVELLCLVDETIDGLLQGLPGQSLIGFTRLIRDTLLHHPIYGNIITLILQKKSIFPCQILYVDCFENGYKSIKKNPE